MTLNTHAVARDINRVLNNVAEEIQKPIEYVACTLDDLFGGFGQVAVLVVVTFAVMTGILNVLAF
jgi:hypothetical protein